MKIVEITEFWFKKSKRLIVKYDILVAVLCAAALIIVSFWLGYQNSRIVPINLLSRYSSNNPLAVLASWDGPYYIYIAEHGYTTLLSASFYPFYPLIVRIVYYALRSYLVSALFVSWAGLIGAIYFYIKIIRQLGLENKRSTRVMSILPFIFFPAAIFMLAAYPEGLFAALALGSIYFSLRRRYISAGALLLLANLTHITGVFLIVMDALILWEEKVSLRKITRVVAMGACGIGAFMVFLFMHYHNALAFLESQTQLHGWLGGSYYHLILGITLIDILLLALLVASVFFYWRRRKSFAVYSALFLLIPLLGIQWGGFDRYVLMAFPIPLMIYESLRRKPQAYMIVIILSVILWAYTLLQYTSGYTGS